jgi:hypothetical protein
LAFLLFFLCWHGAAKSGSVLPMQRLFIFALVWLAGSAPALAMAADWFTKGESLSYRVYWGPLSLGRANLAFNSTVGGYIAQATVKGSMVFFKMDDTWTATGKVGKSSLISQEYRAIQAENSYRANKRLTFDQKKHTMLYENLHDTHEAKLTVKLPEGGPTAAQDPFSALYDLRKNGLPTQPLTREVMGLKRPFYLQIEVPQPQTVNGEKLLKVTLHKTDPAKPGVETWHIWLTDNAELVPVEIDAQLKIGSFRAVLDDGKAAATQQENIE